MIDQAIYNMLIINCNLPIMKFQELINSTRVKLIYFGQQLDSNFIYFIVGKQ